MRYGLTLSLLFHSLLIGVLLLGLPIMSRPIAEPSTDVPIEVARFEEETNPPPGRKEEQRDEDRSDDETAAKSRAADGGRTQPIARPQAAPERAPEPDPAQPPDAAIPPTVAPKTNAAAPDRPPPAPPERPRLADVPQPRPPEKAPATPQNERKTAKLDRPPPPPEPERDEIALRPPPPVTAPNSKAPPNPEASPEASPAKRPTAPPKAAPQQEEAALRPPPPVTAPSARAPPNPLAAPDASPVKRPAAPPKPVPQQEAALRPPAAVGKTAPKPPQRDVAQIKSKPTYRPPQLEKVPVASQESAAKKHAPTPSKLDSILRSLDRERKAPTTADAERSAREQRQGSPQHRPGIPLSISEIDALKRQIRRCWSADAAAKDLDKLTVWIEIWMNADGTVREARIAPETRLHGAAHRAAAERALRAVQNERCQPYKLPPEKFARWQHMTVEFAPTDQ